MAGHPARAWVWVDSPLDFDFVVLALRMLWLVAGGVVNFFFSALLFIICLFKFKKVRKNDYTLNG